MQEHSTAALAGADASPAVAAAMAGRAELMAATDRNRRAVLEPREPGGLPPAQRLALAVRVARLNGDDALAAHYRGAAPPPGPDPALADPAAPPPADPRLAAIVGHVDLVSRSPRDATRADVGRLLAAGVAEADVVRLSQLVAFLGYEVRLLAGLRLLGATS